MSENRITVVINGNEYTLRGDESTDDMVKVASYVDNEIKKLTSINNRLNPTYAAVLAALNVTNSYFKIQKEYADYKISVQELIRQLNEIKNDYNNLLKDNIMLKEQLDSSSKESNKNDEEIKSIKEQYETLYNEFISRGDELTKARRDAEMLKKDRDNKQKELDKVKMELSESKYKLIDLQNQLLRNQIDLVKVTKEFNEFKTNYNVENEQNDV